MALSIFGFLQITGKLLSYLGYAAIAGAFYAPLLCGGSLQENVRRDTLPTYLRWCFIALIIGIAGALVWFFAKTGALASRGINGALDPVMLKILWSTAPGDALLIKLSAFSAALVMIFLYSLTRYQHQQWFLVGVGVAMVGAATSSTLTGHISQQALPEHIALVLHIIAVSWWIGALPLLIAISYQHPPQCVKAIMLRFGHHAWLPVILLLVTGTGMLASLVDLPGALYRSLYGNIFIVKTVFVLMILGLAAWHKWQLVPKLTRRQHTLARSIQIECLIAISILLATATFTTITGPEH